MKPLNQSSDRLGRLVTNVLLACLLVAYWQANKNEIFGGWYGWDYDTVTFDLGSFSTELDSWEQGEDVRAKSGWRLFAPAGDAD